MTTVSPDFEKEQIGRFYELLQHADIDPRIFEKALLNKKCSTIEDFCHHLICLINPWDKDVIHKLMLCQLVDFKSIFFFETNRIQKMKAELTMFLINFPQFRSNDYREIIQLMGEALQECNRGREPNEMYQYINLIPAFGGLLKSWNEHIPEPNIFLMSQLKKEEYDDIYLKHNQIIHLSQELIESPDE